MSNFITWTILLMFPCIEQAESEIFEIICVRDKPRCSIRPNYYSTMDFKKNPYVHSELKVNVSGEVQVFSGCSDSELDAKFYAVHLDDGQRYSSTPCSEPSEFCSSAEELQRNCEEGFKKDSIVMAKLENSFDWYPIQIGNTKTFTEMRPDMHRDSIDYDGNDYLLACIDFENDALIAITHTNEPKFKGELHETWHNYDCDSAQFAYVRILDEYVPRNDVQAMEY